MKPFRPIPDSTANINVGSATASVKIPNASPNMNTIRIMNDGTATVWIRAGNSGVTADTTNDIPIGAGATEVLDFDARGDELYIAAIAAAATGKIYFTPGDGI